MLFTYLLWTVLSLVFIPVMVLLSLLPKSIRYDNRVYFWLASLYSRLLNGSTFAHVRIKGREHLPAYPHDPSVIACNHASAVAIPLIDWVVGSYPHIWLSKHEYGKVPLLGTLLRRLHVLVPRENARRAVAALAKAARLAADKPRHVILFPEGTRSRSGELQKFRDGASVLAQKLCRPIIPIMIHGAQQVYSISGRINPKATILIEIGAPLQLQEGESRAELTKRLQEWFQARGEGEACYWLHIHSSSTLACP